MPFQIVPKAYAQVDLGEKFTLGVGGAPVKDVYQTPADLVNLIVQNVMVIGGIILFFMLIYAGFKILQDTSKGVEEGVKVLKTALIGFILMFSAYWIVQIIQVMTGTNITL